jgi:allantoin racemase
MGGIVKTILILNPNSSVAVTDKIKAGCAGIDLHPGHRASFHTLTGTPEVLESQREVESVVIPTCDFLLSHPADAYVIGCFSDPGLALCREELRAPVVGIAEAAFREASLIGKRFGVVSIGAGSIARHARAIGALGLGPCLAGDRSLDLGVLDLLDAERSIARIVEVGRQLRDIDGADVLVLGCATMGVYRPRIEEVLAVPVVDPTQAGVLRASALLSFGYKNFY